MKPPPSKPCKSCPFRRKSWAGYLGEHTVDEFIGRWKSDQRMECHKTVDYESPNKTHLEQIEDGDASWCAGALIMFRNDCRLSRDPERPVMEADHEEVFSRENEFREHHDTKAHRGFVARFRGDD